MRTLKTNAALPHPAALGALPEWGCSSRSNPGAADMPSYWIPAYRCHGHRREKKEKNYAGSKTTSYIFIEEEEEWIG
eukprot:1159215-Pelagomonas_calceolata.AAC.4